MIEARHKLWADKVFYPYVRWLFKRHFHAIHLLGEIPDLQADLPLLLLPNHSTWWDGFFVYLLNKKLFSRVGYLMMLEEQLSKYRFFAQIGAYSVNPKLPKSVLSSLNYSVSLLKGQSKPQPMLCLFPQGDLQPWGVRPLNYKRGLEWLLQKYAQPVNILPLAIRVEFLGEQRPEVFFLLGQNYQLNHSTFPGMSWLEKGANILLDDLAIRIVQGEEGQILLQGYRSVNEVFDSFVKTIKRMIKIDRS
ncbi:lysophospholipid acyltransferase family protein [bacterium]|nr:lysophospholipid acyltransferase family protein [bacterium]